MPRPARLGQRRLGIGEGQPAHPPLPVADGQPGKLPAEPGGRVRLGHEERELVAGGGRDVEQLQVQARDRRGWRVLHEPREEEPFQRLRVRGGFRESLLHDPPREVLAGEREPARPERRVERERQPGASRGRAPPVELRRERPRESTQDEADRLQPDDRLVGGEPQREPFQTAARAERLRLAAVRPIVEPRTDVRPEARYERRARQRADLPDRREAEPGKPGTHVRIAREGRGRERGEERGILAGGHADTRDGGRARAGGGGERGREPGPGDPRPRRPREERRERGTDLREKDRLRPPERLQAVELDLERPERRIGGIDWAGDARAERRERIKRRLDGRRVRLGVGRDERGLWGEPVRLPERDPPPDAEIPGGLVRIEDDAVIPRLPAEDQRSVGQVPGRPLPSEPEREM
jgi:hypothetical protein